MPQPRKLSDEQEAAAHAQWVAEKKRHGSVSRIARHFGMSPWGMRDVLDRVERRIDLGVSREALNLDAPQP